ncbi:hypothetical protein B0H63DRAFT_101330 [Podospora didyma]|uniref:Uncharacterized protein n=1 Tax=Podospora didyma TaxID=330526 RepID=A0AAE0NXP4_9PEZI|nr:hypothetical protein B0H63DRAFT_101330 [Podospora didyma]
MPVIRCDQFDAWRPRIGRAVLEPRCPGCLPHLAAPSPTTSRVWVVCLHFLGLVFGVWAMIARPPPWANTVSYLTVHPSSIATPDRLWDRGMMQSCQRGDTGTRYAWNLKVHFRPTLRPVSHLINPSPPCATSSGNAWVPATEKASAPILNTPQFTHSTIFCHDCILQSFGSRSCLNGSLKLLSFFVDSMKA